MKNKINIRNRILKKFKSNPTLELKNRIKHLNSEIKLFYYSNKRFAVRKGLLPGNSKSLWWAVSIAKDIGHPTIPNNMLSNNVNVSGQEISEHFAKFFKKKVEDIVTEINVDNNV